MTAQTIKTAVAGALAELWPERTVYPNFCPDDHARPAALIQILSADPVPANSGLVRWDVKLLIVLWGERDGYGLADEEELTRDQEAVLAALGSPFAVEDRHVLLVPGARGYDEEDGAAFVELSVTWFDVWEGAGRDKTESGDLMEHFHRIFTKTKE